MQLSESILRTSLANSSQADEYNSESKAAVFGARSVCKLLITRDKPLKLADIKNGLGAKSVETLSLRQRHIDVAIDRNWIKLSKNSKKKFVYTITKRLKLIEACLAGNYFEVQKYKKGTHDFNYWLKSISTEIPGRNSGTLKEREYCPLVAGIQSGNEKVIAHLESQGAKITPHPNQKATRGNILHYLATTDYVKTACYVLINKSPHLLNQKNKEKKTPLDIAKAINNKTMQSIFENKIKRLADQNKKMLTNDETTGETSYSPEKITIEEVKTPEPEYSETAYTTKLEMDLIDPKYCSQLRMSEFECFDELVIQPAPVTPSRDQNSTGDRVAPVFNLGPEFEHFDASTDSSIEQTPKDINIECNHDPEISAEIKPYEESTDTEKTGRTTSNLQLASPENTEQLPSEIITHSEPEKQIFHTNPNPTLKDLAKLFYPAPEDKKTLEIRRHFHDHILAAIPEETLPRLRRDSLPISNNHCFPVIIVGSTSFEQHVHSYWGDNPLQLLEGIEMPEGIDTELLKISLIPRDIDLLIRGESSIEDMTQMACKWMKKARESCQSELGVTDIVPSEELAINVNLRTRSVYLLNSENSERKTPNNIIYNVDLTQRSDMPSYFWTSLQEKIPVRSIHEIIKDELDFIINLRGGNERILKAIARLYLLAILEDVTPKLDSLSKELLAQALQTTPYQDPAFHQLAQSLEHPPLYLF